MNEAPANADNPYRPPTATVAEAGTVGPAPAGRGERLGAVLLDGLIFALMVYTPLLVAGASAVVTAIATRQPLVWVAGMFIGVGVAGVMFLVWVVLTIIFVNRNGQTIAKKIIGIKVVRKDGSRAGLGRIFWLRNVVNMLPSMIPIFGALYGLVDALFIFGDARQCVHDKIADTIVVRA
jgi:uncharacterized RDD family membrane protein YckC